MKILFSILKLVVCLAIIWLIGMVLTLKIAHGYTELNQNNLDKVDITCLAMNIYHEARGEDIHGQYAVGNVTMNRVQSDMFPDTVCGVVYQARVKPSWNDPKVMVPVRNKCQFSWYCDGKSDEPKNTETYEQAISIAVSVMLGQINDNTNGALWYHRNDVDPYWNDIYIVVSEIGVHIFYNKES
jgi:spore germination cell wall hydrolase CwlJ-like protein|tara:strand:+ start:14341 stop:14892 length:552 start_codon:yes stop_codon:yes gene_type:complete